MHEAVVHVFGKQQAASVIGCGGQDYGVPDLKRVIGGKPERGLEGRGRRNGQTDQIDPSFDQSTRHLGRLAAFAAKDIVKLTRDLLGQAESFGPDESDDLPSAVPPFGIIDTRSVGQDVGV